jgi:hypothetical protein
MVEMNSPLKHQPNPHTPKAQPQCNHKSVNILSLGEESYYEKQVADERRRQHGVEPCLDVADEVWFWLF